MKSNLPSITTRNPGDERSGARSTTETSIINIPEKVGEILDMKRMDNGIVNE